MITIHGFRTDLSGRNVCHDWPQRHDVKVENALISFAKYELGYGGHVSKILNEGEKISIHVETKILSKLDTTIFCGSKEEIEPLLKMAYIVSSVRDEGTNSFVDIVTNILGDKAGVPFFLVHCSPLIIGEVSVKTSLLFALGAEPGTKGFEELKKYKIDDLCAAWALNNYKIGNIENILGE